MRNNLSDKKLKKEQIIEDYLRLSLNLNMFPQKSSEVPETFLSTNTYISQQRNEDKTDNYQHITPLDITDTQQLTKSSSSNFLNRTVKKPIRMFKNNKNHLSQREFDINTKPFNKKKSLSQLPLKNNNSIFSNEEGSNDIQSRSKILDFKVYLEACTKKYIEKIRFLEEKNKQLEKKVKMRENQRPENNGEIIKDLFKENERLKTTLNYYIELCTNLGEEVIHLQSNLDTYINYKPIKDT